MQDYGESPLILSAASIRQEEQQQRRQQARRESRRAWLAQETSEQRQADLQLTEIDEEPENNVRLLSRDNIV